LMWSLRNRSGTCRKYEAGMTDRNQGTTLSRVRLCCWANSYTMAFWVTRWTSTLCAACHGTAGALLRGNLMSPPRLPYSELAPGMITSSRRCATGVEPA
jgi:hypothetical protein